ncbi:hypothetical protein AABB24_010492, partial [Solanum stoloniferum]
IFLKRAAAPLLSLSCLLSSSLRRGQQSLAASDFLFSLLWQAVLVSNNSNEAAAASSLSSLRPANTGQSAVAARHRGSNNSGETTSTDESTCNNSFGQQLGEMSSNNESQRDPRVPAPRFSPIRSIANNNSDQTRQARSTISHI